MQLLSSIARDGRFGKWFRIAYGVWRRSRKGITELHGEETQRSAERRALQVSFSRDRDNMLSRNVHNSCRLVNVRLSGSWMFSNTMRQPSSSRSSQKRSKQAMYRGRGDLGDKMHAPGRLRLRRGLRLRRCHAKVGGSERRVTANCEQSSRQALTDRLQYAHEAQPDRSIIGRRENSGE